MKRIASTLGTVAIAASVVLGTAAQANAVAIVAFGPYKTMSVCQIHQRDLQKAGGYTIAQGCHYVPERYDDGRGVTFPAGYMIVATRP